jgi:flagellar motor switch protein FliG
MFSLPEAMPARESSQLTQVQKAAVIVRLLVMGGADPGIGALPAAQQRRLVREMSALRLVDRETLARTVAEFSAELDGIGLHFPRDVDRVLQMLNGAVSQEVVAALLAETGGDPALLGGAAWAEIAERDDDSLNALIAGESDEVCAVLLCKLPPSRAAKLLSALPEDRAAAVSRALAAAEGMTPDATARVGAALGARAGAGSGASEAAARVAGILNAATAKARGATLAGIETADPAFAARVRAAVFGWENVPARLDARDVPKVLRGLPDGAAVTAMAAEPEGPVASYILGAISSRLADQLREAIAEAGPPTADAFEEATGAIVAEIRRLEEEGTLTLRAEDS